MRILVTGGAGFIGSHVTERLVAGGHEVRVLDNLSSGRQEHLAAVFDRIECVIGDVRDRGDVAFALRDRDAVIHLAAIASVPASIADPAGTHETNFGATLTLLDIAARKNIRCFVYASSAAVYGPNAIPPAREDAAARPASPYAADKLAGEHFLRFYTERFRFFGTALRFFNVYGPRQDPGSSYSGVISRFLAAVRGRSPVALFGDGRQSRDFVAVSDVARCVEQALRIAPEAFNVVNVGTGRESSLLDVLAIMEEALGVRIERRFEAPRAGDIMRSCADVSRMRRFGLSCDISLKQGMATLMRTSGMAIPYSVQQGRKQGAVPLHEFAFAAKEIEDGQNGLAPGVFAE
ncbi:MAG: NAD-dependent epimerase/dehydratase family protein [Acidiferrobacteraceae bacterium]